MDQRRAMPRHTLGGTVMTSHRFAAVAALVVQTANPATKEGRAALKGLKPVMAPKAPPRPEVRHCSEHGADWSPIPEDLVLKFAKYRDGVRARAYHTDAAAPCCALEEIQEAQELKVPVTQGGPAAWLKGALNFLDLHYLKVEIPGKPAWYDLRDGKPDEGTVVFRTFASAVRVEEEPEIPRVSRVVEVRPALPEGLEVLQKKHFRRCESCGDRVQVARRSRSGVALCPLHHGPSWLRVREVPGQAATGTGRRIELAKAQLIQSGDREIEVFGHHAFVRGVVQAELAWLFADPPTIVLTRKRGGIDVIAEEVNSLLDEGWRLDQITVELPGDFEAWKTRLMLGGKPGYAYVEMCNPASKAWSRYSKDFPILNDSRLKEASSIKVDVLGNVTGLEVQVKSLADRVREALETPGSAIINRSEERRMVTVKKAGNDVQEVDPDHLMGAGTVTFPAEMPEIGGRVFEAKIPFAPGNAQVVVKVDETSITCLSADRRLAYEKAVADAKLAAEAAERDRARKEAEAKRNAPKSQPTGDGKKNKGGKKNGKEDKNGKGKGGQNGRR